MGSTATNMTQLLYHHQTAEPSEQTGYAGATPAFHDDKRDSADASHMSSII